VFVAQTVVVVVKSVMLWLSKRVRESGVDGDDNDGRDGTRLGQNAELCLRACPKQQTSAGCKNAATAAAVRGHSEMGG